MLMRTDPFRELDRLTQQFLNTTGTWSRPTPMPLDAYRAGEEYVICFDLPGVDPQAIDIDVERNMLTVKAERRPRQEGEDVRWELTERPLGVFSRQVMLSDTLDPSGITADYDCGVLTLKIPVAEKAKPRKITISHSGNPKQLQA
ncbi:Hsp20/alpha crystallin family protein [Streptomyces sp. SP17BM10]|uniref:Hsp20/alpha crystallin family protein n=1 Tax=Streptomyces sp. SP17BM10 TaxID=3002530 RepID=UPI002E79725F|nr:Hsp20/alpha crystallin family protein [Streptomyces sp. SP17BM10]MEE1783809.1 Hsp20/alpha crystallin family protein [Streptomyces sp. SP17BM10]